MEDGTQVFDLGNDRLSALGVGAWVEQGKEEEDDVSVVLLE